MEDTATTFEAEGGVVRGLMGGSPCRPARLRRPGRRLPTHQPRRNLLTDYFVLSWMPQMVADAGHSASAATVISSLSSLAGVGASILFGLVTRRFRSSQEAAALMIGLGLATALFGQTPSSFSALSGVAMLTGAFLFSGTVVLYTLIVDSFEPRVRVTGVGLVMGVGRISGVLAPAAAGALFAAGDR